MNVDDTAAKCGQKAAFDNAHEPGERDNLGPGFLKPGDVLLFGLAIDLGLERGSTDEVSRDAVAAGPFKNRGIFDICNHTDDLCVELASLNGIDNGLAITPASGTKYSNLEWCFA